MESNTNNTLNLTNTWVFDTEVYPNCFVLVAKSLADPKEYLKYVLHEDVELIRDDYTHIQEWLRTRPTLIGFNSLGFDGQILELLWTSPKRVSTQQIYDFVDGLISGQKEDRFNLPYKEWSMSFSHVDLFKINHYDNSKTSLKWLEFSMRAPKMQDLPFPVGTHISTSNLTKLVNYCKNDVDNPHELFNRCMSMIVFRKELVDEHNNPRLMNMSDSSIGEYIVLDYLKKSGLKQKDLEATVKRDTIAIADHILDYVGFSSPEMQGVLDIFKATVLTDVNENGIKGFITPQATFKSVVYDFGVGGLHAFHAPGVYRSDEEYVIYTIDVSSFYPNLAIVNEFYPEHLGKTFCRVYKEIYDRRSLYPKGSSMNGALKKALVCVYGKSNQKFSKLRDPVYTIKTTVNGQLLLSMLAEELSLIGQILIGNTDGIEIRIPRKAVDELKDVCSQWEILTGLKLEYDTYRLLACRDVNNYIAVTESGTIKRKGLFRIYYDYTEEDNKEHHYDENPSATVIGEALCEYYANDRPIEDYISAENSIYPFLYGIKGRKGFKYWFITADESGVVDIEKRSEKAIRFFMRKKGANIFKFWEDNRVNNLQAVRRGHLVESAMNIRNPEIVSIKKKRDKTSEIVTNYEVNKDFYIQECYEIIQKIESGQFSNWERRVIIHSEGENVFESAELAEQ